MYITQYYAERKRTEQCHKNFHVLTYVPYGFLQLDNDTDAVTRYFRACEQLSQN